MFLVFFEVVGTSATQAKGKANTVCLKFSQKYSQHELSVLFLGVIINKGESHSYIRVVLRFV